MNQLMRFSNSAKHDPEVETWLKRHSGEMGSIAEHWFGIMRKCGHDVRELMHDGCPVACVGDAAFGYVNIFRSHVNVGFFRGAEIADPTGLLVGTGKYMRHVKLKPGRDIDAAALSALISTAYQDMQQRMLEIENKGVFHECG